MWTSTSALESPWITPPSQLLSALHSQQRKSKCALQDSVLCSWEKWQALSSRNLLGSLPAQRKPSDICWHLLCAPVWPGTHLWQGSGLRGGKRLRAVNTVGDCETYPKTKFALGFKSPSSAQLGKRIILPTKKKEWGGESTTPRDTTMWNNIRPHHWLEPLFLLVPLCMLPLLLDGKKSSTHWLTPWAQILTPPPAWCGILSKSPNLFFFSFLFVKMRKVIIPTSLGWGRIKQDNDYRLLRTGIGAWKVVN